MGITEKTCQLETRRQSEYEMMKDEIEKMKDEFDLYIRENDEMHSQQQTKLKNMRNNMILSFSSKIEALKGKSQEFSKDLEEKQRQRTEMESKISQSEEEFTELDASIQANEAERFANFKGLFLANDHVSLDMENLQRFGEVSEETVFRKK